MSSSSRLKYKNFWFHDNDFGRKVEDEKFFIYAHNNKAGVDANFDEVRVSKEIKTLADVDALLNFLPQHDEFFLCAWNYEALSKLLEPKKEYKYPVDRRTKGRRVEYQNAVFIDNYGGEFRLPADRQYWATVMSSSKNLVKGEITSLAQVDKLIADAAPETRIYLGVQTFEEIKALVDAQPKPKPKAKRGRPRTKTPDYIISSYQARRQADNVHNLQNALEIERKQKLAYRDERDALKQRNENQADVFKELLVLLPVAGTIERLPQEVRSLQNKLDRAKAVLNA